VSPSFNRWWPERVLITLSPAGDCVGDREPWRGALEALKRKVSTLKNRTDVSVVLSNHFARYALVPPADGATADEELALARFHFARIHGERAKSWEVRLSGGIACAIDTQLLSELKEIFSKQKKIKLVSVQPYLMHAYNQWRPRIPRAGAWLVLAEPERVCLARLSAQGWASVHNGRETDWEQLLERERNRASGEPLPALVLRGEL
jgi:hypothetical protein